jgi:hypothetical protein
LRGGIAQHALIVLFHRVDGQRRLGKVGFGIVERDLELLRIEPI